MTQFGASQLSVLSAQSKSLRARRTACAGLFIVGTDTAVGKTFVAARIVGALAWAGLRVGIYKPAASGCRRVDGLLISDDAIALWEAAGQPGRLNAVCP